MEELPKFKYHPNPLATGSIVKSGTRCECCGKQRGFKYTRSIYARERVETICPWCISDGTAAKTYDGTFVDGHSLSIGGVAKDVVDEVTKRTPGYICWQEEEWQVCCGDACEFHGDLSTEEMAEISLEQFQSAFDDPGLDQGDFLSFKNSYQPGGNPSIYKWICRHCRKEILYADYS